MEVTKLLATTICVVGPSRPSALRPSGEEPLRPLTESSYNSSKPRTQELEQTIFGNLSEVYVPSSVIVGTSSASSPTSFGSGSVIVSTTQSRAVVGDTAIASAYVQPVTSVMTQSSGIQSSILIRDTINDKSSDSTVTPSKRAPRYGGSPGREMCYHIKSTVEENIEVMAKHFKCFQCFRVFKDVSEVRDAKAQKHHYCATEGVLKTPLKLYNSPSPAKRSLLSCIICQGVKPIFLDNTELIKHIALAHKARFFKKEISKRYPKDKLFGKCYKNCDYESISLEDTILHLAVEHQKLFWALKHDKDNDFKILIKRLFPDKLRDNSHLNWNKSAASEFESGGYTAKRKLNVDEFEDTNTAKKSKVDVTEPVSKDPVEDSVSVKLKMTKEQCPMCPEVTSNQSTLKVHLIKHFESR